MPRDIELRYHLISLILAALAAIGPFSIDTYLPAFPEMRAALGASQLGVQQSLTAYLLPYSLIDRKSVV